MLEMAINNVGILLYYLCKNVVFSDYKMVRNYVRKKLTPGQQAYEADMQKAIKMVLEGGKRVADVVRHFDGRIKDQTLRDRVNRRRESNTLDLSGKTVRVGRPTTLSPEVEEHLAGIFGYLSEYGHPQVKYLPIFLILSCKYISGR